MQTAARFSNSNCGALFTMMAFFGAGVGLGRAMSRLSVSAYMEFHQHTNRTFDPYMPIVVIGALAGGVALAVMYGVHSIPGHLPQQVQSAMRS